MKIKPGLTFEKGVSMAPGAIQHNNNLNFEFMLKLGGYAACMSSEQRHS